MKGIKYSVVVAAYNEEESLPLFFSKVVPLFETLGETFEIIITNDGSSDGTEDILAQRCAADKRVKGINFSRNFGQQAALLAGLKESRGDAVIVMDADLQDPPEVALEMIEKYKEGYDIVHGRRKKRPGESVFKKVTARLYYKFIHRISNPKVPENVGDFKLYSRRAVDAILSLPERNRLIRAQAAWVGFRQTFVEFDRPARAVGETKYTLKKMVKLASDGIISNSYYPLYLALKAGILLGVLSAAAFLTFIILAICGVYLPLAAWLFPTVTLLFAIHLTIKGLTDIYTARIYDEVKNRPVYVIKDKFNSNEDD
ncbi:MAG: glycosyltransferase family 2 protein [Clostridia bacterium]|nr:glycosyltransferase family 2 protein [Clostridia bacterium]MBQ9481782.1 glycosyltransferase family 2 protein [Clostridia bacterium]